MDKKILKTIKETFNEKIYKHAKAIYKEQGKQALLIYLKTFFREDVDVENLLGIEK